MCSQWNQVASPDNPPTDAEVNDPGNFSANRVSTWFIKVAVVSVVTVTQFLLSLYSQSKDKSCSGGDHATASARNTGCTPALKPA